MDRWQALVSPVSPIVELNIVLNVFLIKGHKAECVGIICSMKRRWRLLRKRKMRKLQGGKR